MEERERHISQIFMILKLCSDIRFTHIASTSVYDQDWHQWFKNVIILQGVTVVHPVLGKNMLNIISQGWQKETRSNSAICYSPFLFFVTKIPSLLEIKYTHLFLRENIPKVSFNHSIRLKVQNLVVLSTLLADISHLLMQKLMNHVLKLSAPAPPQTRPT